MHIPLERFQGFGLQGIISQTSITVESRLEKMLIITGAYNFFY